MKSGSIDLRLLIPPSDIWLFSFKNLPPYSDIHHFVNGVSGLPSITAKEQGIVLCVSRPFPTCAGINHLQYISPLMHGVKVGEHNKDELMIPALRALACVLVLARFHAHTSETLSLLKHHIHLFGELVKVCDYYKSELLCRY